MGIWWSVLTFQGRLYGWTAPSNHIARYNDTNEKWTCFLLGWLCCIGTTLPFWWVFLHLASIGPVHTHPLACKSCDAFGQDGIARSLCKTQAFCPLGEGAKWKRTLGGWMKKRRQSEWKKEQNYSAERRHQSWRIIEKKKTNVKAEDLERRSSFSE